MIGQLKLSDGGHLYLKRDKFSKMTGKGGFSWPFYRFKIKEKLKTAIENNYGDSSSGSLLSSLLLGTAAKNHLSREFNRFGLSHLLAISGFHFGLLSMLICAILGRFCPYRWIPYLSILLLTLYTLILEPNPSALRAFVTFLHGQLGLLLGRSSTSLNRLGVALIITLLINPAFSTHLGFQFSFAITASILIFFRPIDELLQHLSSQFKEKEIIQLSLFDKHALLLLQIFRKLIALTLSVQVTALPLTLFWFGKFPVLSLLYNLFFPPLISLSVLIFFAALLFPPLHQINHLFIQGLLRTLQIPATKDLFIETDLVGPVVIFSYFAFLIMLGMWLQEKQLKQSLLEYY